MAKKVRKRPAKKAKKLPARKAIKSNRQLIAFQKSCTRSSRGPVVELRDAFRDVRVVSGANCGDAGGVQLGIRNTNTSNRVQAYYEITSNVNGPWQGNRLVGPGQTVWIICSALRYSGGIQFFNLRITGAHYA